MNQLTNAAELLLTLQVAPREAMALGIIQRMGGTAKSTDIVAGFSQGTRAPMSAVAQLRAKGLVVRHAPGFWALTETGIRAIQKAERRAK
jgi:Mn-dependent DtxR family transcriptional regulator